MNYAPLTWYEQEYLRCKANFEALPRAPWSLRLFALKVLSQRERTIWSLPKLLLLKQSESSVKIHRYCQFGGVAACIFRSLLVYVSDTVKNVEDKVSITGEKTSYVESVRFVMAAYVYYLLFLLPLYALQLHSLNVLTFSTYNFHLLRSWMQFVQFFIFSFFMLFLMSSSHLFFGLPSGCVNIGFHLYTLFTILCSGIRCK